MGSFHPIHLILWVNFREFTTWKLNKKQVEESSRKYSGKKLKESHALGFIGSLALNTYVATFRCTFSYTNKVNTFY